MLDPSQATRPHLNAALQLATATDETHLPPDVVTTIRFFTDAGVWFQLSRNQEAEGCRDAARKRNRLGHRGIPLWDELKSFLASFVDEQGHRRLIMAHCRGDRRLDLEALGRVLHAKKLPAKIGEFEAASIGTGYGRVNPFVVGGEHSKDLREPVPLQIFDHDLCNRLGVPGTIMTNAGDRTWGVEFYPDELIAIMPEASVAVIAERDPQEPERPLGLVEPRPIGIITGNAPESGMALWGHVNRNVRELLGSHAIGDVSMPPVHVTSLPQLGLSMELENRVPPVQDALETGAGSLCRAGAKLVTLACNTTQYFTPELRVICAAHGADFLPIAEAVGRWLHGRGVGRVALLGIRYVTELDTWSAYREPLHGIDVEQLSPEAVELIHQVAYEVKTHGVNVTNLNHFRDLLRKHVRSQYVIVALTELSLLLRDKRWRGDAGKTLVDPLAIYGEAIACWWLGLPFPMDSDREVSAGLEHGDPNTSSGE